MKRTISLNIEVKEIDNGLVTTVSNEHGMLIASWYDATINETLDKIAAQIEVCLSIKRIEDVTDDPYPYTKGLENRKLTRLEAEKMDNEMEEIREEHLGRGLKTGAEDAFEQAQEEEF